MTICVKDLSGSGSQHDPLTVSYAVVGGWFSSLKTFNELYYEHGSYYINYNMITMMMINRF